MSAAESTISVMKGRSIGYHYPKSGKFSSSKRTSIASNKSSTPSKNRLTEATGKKSKTKRKASVAAK